MRAGGYRGCKGSLFDHVGTLPDGSFAASGYRGHKVLVIPQWDLVIVHRVNTFEEEGSVSTTGFGQLLKRILAAWPRG